MKALQLLFLILLTTGCAQRPTSTPGPSPTKSELVLADEMLAAQDFEGAAVAYRQVLDHMETTGAPPDLQRSVREKCTLALAEAGGFVSSRRVWEEMALKNPESKMEAERMKARAERMMIMQGEELLIQASEDLAQGHRSKALATANACGLLFEGLGASEQAKTRLDTLLSRLYEGGPREVEASQ